MIRKEFILFVLLFSIFSFSSCDKERNNPKEDPKEELWSRWESVEFSYDMPPDPTTGKIDKHTWPFSSLTQGCDVDFIKLDGAKATLSVSEPNENNSCEAKIKSGKVEGNTIVFEGEEDRPRTIVERSAKYLKLKYKANYEKYPKMDFVVLYKNTDPNIKDELPSDKKEYVGNWLAKDFSYKIPGSTYVPPVRDASSLISSLCENTENDLLIIKDDNTVELRFYREKPCDLTVYKGKIENDVIVFEQDEVNPRKIVYYDGMFLSISYKELDHNNTSIGEDFVMRFQKK